MKRALLGAGFLFLTIIGPLRADDATASAQQALKDQGFYYGEITGRKDTDTTAAIRRYQIRNGLKITGELNTETLRSLRVAGTESKQPGVASPDRPSQDDTDLRNRDARPTQPPPDQNRPRDVPSPTYAPEPYRYRQESNGFFYGTPYENVSFDIQQRVISDAQIFLARRGYYRSDIDGIFGPGTEFALRAFQSRSRLPVTGRLDMPTLRALGLMPGRRIPAQRFPPRGFPRPVYRGQWIPG